MIKIKIIIMITMFFTNEIEKGTESKHSKLLEKIVKAHA